MRAAKALGAFWSDISSGRKPSSDLRRDAELAADELAVGGRRLIDRFFETMESERPRLAWHPEAGRFGCDVLDFLHEFWLERRWRAGPPSSRTIDPLDLKPALGSMALLEPCAGGGDFRFRLYGARITLYSKIDMTGRCVWDIPSAYLAAFFFAIYRAVSIRRQPLRAFHRCRLDQCHAEWDRLILPFVDDEGAVSRLLVGTVPRVRR